MEENKQAVAEETKEGSQTPPETGGAREESLEELLSEFEGAETQPEQKQEPDDLKEVLSYFKEERQRQAAERARENIDKAVKVIKGELGDLPVSERALKRMLEGAAIENPAIANAWASARGDVSKLGKVLKGLAEDFRSDFPNIDKAATDDREAVAAAVRSASTKTPSDDFDENSLKGMSDAEFEMAVQRMGRA